MKITVPVTVNINIEFDMTPEETVCYQDGQDLGLENLARSTKEAIEHCLRERDVGQDLMDDMVEQITDRTGWSIYGLSLTTAREGLTSWT